MRPSCVPSLGASGALRAGVITYVAVLVVLPLLALVQQGLGGGFGVLWEAVASPVAASALWLTLWTALAMAALNAVMGAATAWVLVRYRFPGRAFLSALLDLPFAIPTLVAGIMLVILFGPGSPLGRAVEPVLTELDPDEEEAAGTLGAGRWRTFFEVILPPLLPAIGCGAVQCFARALAEFGSIVVVSGNMPRRTLTASVYLFGEIESGRPEIAAAVAVVLLAAAVGLMFLTRGLERLAGVRRG
jgi:sulfate transport system permease protein